MICWYVNRGRLRHPWADVLPRVDDPQRQEALEPLGRAQAAPGTRSTHPSRVRSASGARSRARRRRRARRSPSPPWRTRAAGRRSSRTRADRGRARDGARRAARSGGATRTSAGASRAGEDDSSPAPASATWNVIPFAPMNRCLTPSKCGRSVGNAMARQAIRRPQAPDSRPTRLSPGRTLTQRWGS